jgi:1-deoxy-D-xylulose-5-phosphate synthase
MDTNNSDYPLLSHIDSPADLRKMSVDQLPAVCQDIRDFLINSLSQNPGHFASSMGAVELTVALHYVFNTPYDRIVWDVGHQAYGHKLLTGRRDRFDTNRKLGGISGFPKPAESEYDTFTAGHASNSISVALGFAIAGELKHETPQRNVVAVIGDASISGGLAFEGINNAANTPNNLLIILNDNDMSIDPNVGSLNSYLAHITSSKSYNNLRNRTYRFMRKLGLVSDKRRGKILRFNNSLKSLLADEQNIFEGLNIRYFGPLDGHDVKSIVKVLNDIKDMKGPRILHLKTVKGKGFEPAEKDPAKWHAPGKFNPETGERKKAPKSGVPQKYQDVFGDALLELARADERVVAVTAAMPSGTSVGTLQKAMPERAFDVGISEGHAVTFAGGLAKEGMRPVVAIYSSFLQRSYDHMIHDVAIEGLPVTFAIDRAGIVGEDGATHHGLFDLAYMRSIPGMTVSAPSDEIMLRDLLFTAHSHNGPFALRYPRGNGKHIGAFPPMKALPIGRGAKVSDGNDAVVLSIGTIAESVKEAVARLKEEGVNVAHYDMIFLKPIDTDILAEVAAKHCPVITVEDATEIGGLGSAVAEWMAEHGCGVPLRRVAISDSFVEHGTPAELHHLCGTDADGIYSTIKSVLSK